MVLQPMSDIPPIGKMPVCKFFGVLFVLTTDVLSQFGVVVFQVVICTTHDIVSLIVMRFIAGLFAAPPLATGGATMGDMWAPGPLAFALTIWAFGAITGSVQRSTSNEEPS
jgi:DHA1 family multidrug resistance protein-like MFS transporter